MNKFILLNIVVLIQIPISFKTQSLEPTFFPKLQV